MKSRRDLKRAAAQEVPVADYIPYSAHVAPNVIRLKDSGDFLAIWKLEGLPFQTTEFDDLNTRKEALNNFVRSLGGGQFALWSHKLRRKTADRLTGHFENAFCRKLDDKYYATLAQNGLMSTELYLSVLYRPRPTQIARLFGRAEKATREQLERNIREGIQVLDDVGRQIESSLARYKPARLASHERNGVAYSEMCTFLGFLVNGVWEDVALREGRIAEYLPCARLLFGDRNGILQIEHPNTRKFVGFLDVLEYAPWVETGSLNVLFWGDYEWIETMSFSMLAKTDARERLERQRGQMISSEEASITEIEEMDVAVDDLAHGVLEVGEYHYSLAVFGNSVEGAARNLAHARSRFDGPAFKMAVNDAVPEAAWFSQLPGNWWMRPREAFLTSYAFACLSPFHSFGMGKRSGNPWGDAITLLKTPNGQPYYFNFHSSSPDHDATDEKLPGNTTVLGATGVGKTATVAFLLSQTLKTPARMVLFDKDRGLEIFVRAVGGRYRTFKRGEATGINPFQWKDSPATRALCVNMVALCVGAATHSLTAQEVMDIRHAVDTVFRMPPPIRRLGAVDQALPNKGDNSLRVRLRKWIGNEPLGWVLDNASDTLAMSSTRVVGLDYTEFLDDPEIRPVLMYVLLEAVQGLIDGKPMLFFMDEFWKPLQEKVFSDFARNKLKTIRKESGLGIFATQSPSDALQHEIARTVVEQSVTLICLPNPRADRDDYVNGFKLTPQEFEVIRALGEDSRMMLIKQGDRSEVVKLDLSAFQDELVVLSGSTDNVALMDEAMAEVGVDPAHWLPVLLRKVARRKAGIRAPIQLAA